MTAKFKYKCRLCKKEYFSGLEAGLPAGITALTTLVITGRDYNAIIHNTMSVSMMESHYCNGYDEKKPDFKIGVADLIGLETE